jgi:drug/metabolite transporter (DMT)-like permease
MPPEAIDPKPLAAAPANVQSDAVRARLLLVALCLGWGTAWVTMRIALSEIPPFTMRACGHLLGATVLVALAKLQGRSFRVADRRTWAHTAMAAMFNVVAFSIFTAFAQLNTETSRVAILVYTMPVWATLLAMTVLGERLTATRTVALLLCASGMTILIAPLAAAGFPAGTLLAGGAAMSWAAGTVYLKWARPEGDLMALTTWQLVIGFGVMLGCIPLFDGTPDLNVSTVALLSLLFSGVVGSGLGMFLWFDIVRRVPATTASLGVLSTPVIGVVTAMVVLGERPTLADAAGFALMLSASAVVLLRPERTARA